MKNLTRGLLSTLAIMLLAAFSLQAQVTAEVTLNVQLKHVASIVINGTNTTADLSYSDPADYTNGVETDQTNAMTVVSNQPYNVSVSAKGELVNGTDQIPVADVTVTPTASAGTPTATLTGQPIPVGVGSAVNIIESPEGTATQDFDLNYSTMAAPTLDFIGLPEGTYTATLTYTLTNP